MQISDLIAQKIFDIRQRLGLTQSEFGKILNSSYQSVSAWEKGRNMPDITTILKIINIAGITCDEFFSEVTQVAEETDSAIYVTPDEKRCLYKLRALPPKDRRAFETILLDF